MSQSAARVGDAQICPQFDGNRPHVGGTITEGARSVLIGGQRAAIAGGKCRCTGSSRSNAVAGGSRSVLIEGQFAIRTGDRTEHGGIVTSGCASVLIGE